MNERWGIPVVDATNVYDVLAELGVRPWRHTAPPVSMEEYVHRDLAEPQRADLRFALRQEVVFLEQPTGGGFTGFRGVGKPWATVFTLLPGDLVPLVGEWKHGEEVVSLVPPSGVPHREEMSIDDVLLRMQTCGAREYEEETGFRLESIEPLCDAAGVPVSARKMHNERCYPFLGRVAEPIEQGPSKFDDTEHLQLVLMPLGELLRLIREGRMLEGSTDIVVLRALLHLRRFFCLEP